MFSETIQRSSVVARFATLLALGAAAGCSSGNGSPAATGGTSVTSGGAGPSTGGSTSAGGAGGISSTGGATTSANTGGSVGTGGTASGGAATGGTTGGTASGGAATGGATGGTASGGAATGGAAGGTAGTSATGGARTGGTAGTSTAGGAATGGATGGAAGNTGGAATGGAAGGTAGSSATGGAATGGATGGTAGSGGGSGAGGGTLIGGPGPASQLIAQSGTDWGKLVIDTEIAGKTSLGSTYPEGLILHGMSKAYKRLKDPTYLTFLTTSAGKWGVADGSSLDNVMHMAALCDTYEITQTASYKAPADATRRIFDTYPTVQGAFWHANNGTRDHQLWGDGVFMSLSFLTRYATVFNDPTVYPIAVTNLSVTSTHLKNSATNLFWHAYDDSGVATWSKTASKTNEISWGRAMGWFSLASVMTLEMLPADDPGRAQIETILKDLLTAVAKYQDPVTGRWFQVVDMGTNAQDWVETSCSSMYSYAIWWAYQHGLLDASYAAVATKGFNGVMQMVTKNATNQTTIAKICTGLNASAAVTDYFSHATASNDLHGIGSFLLMWEGMQ